jgi:Tol biopolymer transport system component/tRNA A-37 threonylcarbamoyl transferase component Bud32
MPLGPGVRLGPYEIVAALGAGGMGEVYRGRDTRLKRDVALKVLSELFASDPDRLARFQREAEVLASLSHPNIAAIHGFEESNGTSALVMELVEGEDLSQRIARGAIPIDEALPIAKQIAEALEAAHEQGIIHRDLKPANIKVRPDGTVKVLDFGLAKLAESPAATSRGPAVLSMSPTITSPAMLTGVGMLLGTAAYMSPEQARGKVADKRSDIWAFGCVLFEMLTGKRAFNGEDVGDTLAAVLKTEPEWTLLPDGTPPSIRVLLRRSLNKDRQQRLGDAGVVRLEIDDALVRTTAPVTAYAPVRRQDFSLMQTGLVAAVAVAIGVGLGMRLSRPADAPKPSGAARFALTLPPGTELAAGAAVAISPNGANVAFVASRGGGAPRISIRSINATEPRTFDGTEGAAAPFFSPNGEWLAFFADGKLKKISTSGGVVTPLADADAQGGSWGLDDRIVFRKGGELVQVSSAGGQPRPLWSASRSDAATRVPYDPEILPGGTAVLFTSRSGEEDTVDDWSVDVVRLDTGERKVLIQGGHRPHYLATGHLVFLRAGKVMAVPLDVARLALSGTPVPVMEGIQESSFSGGTFSCSQTGSCVYVAGTVNTQRTVAFIDRAGAIQPLPLPPHSYQHPRFSPDGDKVSFWIEQSRCDVVVYDIRRGVLTRITSDGDNHYPVWTPDGREITYLSRKTPPAAYEVYAKSADGSGAEEPLSAVAQNLGPGSELSWTPDGQGLAFGHRGDIWLLTRSERKSRPIVQSRFNETMPAVSPDGRWLAFVSDESGQQEVYVQPFAEPGPKYRISAKGGTEPVWAPRGGELFFRNGTQMMAVNIATQPRFAAATPRALFSQSFSLASERVNYDVSADGQRFVLVGLGDSEHPAEINIVLDWFDELKRLVPAK